MADWYSFISTVDANTMPIFDVRKFGAIEGPNLANGPQNNTAFKNAIEAAGIATDPTGGMVFVPRGVWHLASTIHLTRKVVIQGCGGAGRPNTGDRPGTILQFPDGVVGITVHYPTSPRPSHVSAGRGDGSIIRDLGIYGPTTRVESALAHGIQLWARASIENCSIAYFGGNGIHIEAGVENMKTGFPVTNANFWQIRFTRVERCLGHGLFVYGNDANAGCALALDCSANSKWQIHESSYLGNTYVACHVDPGLSPNVYGLGSYRTENGSPFPKHVNRSILLGCYSEEVTANTGNNGYSSYGNGTHILGGIQQAPLAGGNPLLYGIGDTAFRLLKSVIAAGDTTNRPAFAVMNDGESRFGGAISQAIATYNTNRVLAAYDSIVLADASGGARGYDLPNATTCQGRVYTIKKIDATANTVIVRTASGAGQTIDGVSNYSMTRQHQYVTVASTGTNWVIIANN